MSVLVFIECSEGSPRKSSLEAAAYARALSGQDTTAVVCGPADGAGLQALGRLGIKKILHATDVRLKDPESLAVASVLTQAAVQENADTVVMAANSMTSAVAARVSLRLDSALITGVSGLPEDRTYLRPVFTGKALAKVKASAARQVITVRKNAVETTETGATSGTPEIRIFSPQLSDKDFSIRILESEKASGDVLLPEAEIVVSGGRGMKGPEHWGLIEDLARTLRAATGCSKPVSDMGWRPHHEHVGQTGIKVAPQLYIAVGISGAIQHLAGVNGSKCIVVINKDPDCPFFKAADYGIVGDAFDVLPKLTAAIKAS